MFETISTATRINRYDTTLVMRCQITSQIRTSTKLDGLIQLNVSDPIAIQAIILTIHTKQPAPSLMIEIFCVLYNNCSIRYQTSQSSLHLYLV